MFELHFFVWQSNDSFDFVGADLFRVFYEYDVPARWCGVFVCSAADLDSVFVMQCWHHGLSFDSHPFASDEVGGA